MQAPTLAPSPFGIHGSRIRKIVAAVFAIGVGLFGYGVTATVLEVPPAGWGIVGLVQYVVMAVGALLVSLMALVIVWFARQDQPRPLPRRAMLICGLVGPVLSSGALVVVNWWRVGGPVRVEPFDWVLLGQVVLGLQLFVGALEPAARRRRILVAEAVAVFVITLSVLLATGGTLDLPSIESMLFVGGSAAGVFLLVGGPLYVLGNLLVCRPRYHHIS